MNKKISMREDSKVFDLTALKVLLSVLAISLASMMTKASPPQVTSTEAFRNNGLYPVKGFAFKLRFEDGSTPLKLEH